MSTQAGAKTSTKTKETGVSKKSGITDKSKNEELAIKFAEQLATNGAFVFFARPELDKKGKPKLDKEGKEYLTCYFAQQRNVRGDSVDSEDESLNEDALGWSGRTRIVRALQRVTKENFELDAEKAIPMFQVGKVSMAEYDINGKKEVLPNIYIKVVHQLKPAYEDQNPRQIERDGSMCYITNEAGELTYEVTSPLKAKYLPTGELKANDKLIASDEQRYVPIEDEDIDDEEDEDLEDEE